MSFLENTMDKLLRYPTKQTGVIPFTIFILLLAIVAGFVHFILGI